MPRLPNARSSIHVVIHEDDTVTVPLEAVLPRPFPAALGSRREWLPPA